MSAMEVEAPEPRVRQPLIAILAAMVVGIVVDRGFDVPLGISLVTAAIAWTRWRIGLRSGNSEKLAPRWNSAATFLLLLAIASLSAAWHHVRWNYFRCDEIGFRVAVRPIPVVIRAVALESPQVVLPETAESAAPFRHEISSIVPLQTIAIRHRGTWQLASGKARLYVRGSLNNVAAGDCIEVFGRARRSPPAQNPGDFSFFDYQRTKRQLVRISAYSPASVRVFQTGPRWDPRYWVARFRHQSQQLLWRYLPESEAQLATALLLGNREHLSHTRIERYVRTGTIHLLAISGLHVTIVAFGFYLVARIALVPFRIALLGVVVVATLYMLMSGARPPVVRASALIYVFCLGQSIRRESFGFNSLAAAGIVVLGLNPNELFQVGAQLSFLAVAGMMWYVPLLTAPRRMTELDRFLARHRSYAEVWARVGWRKLQCTVAASVTVWFVALPLVMHEFHIVSTTGVLLNVLLFLPVAIAILAGFGILFAGFTCPPLASGCGWLCSQSIEFIEWLVRAADATPGSHLWVAGPPIAAVAVFYATLLLGMLLPGGRSRWRLWTAAAYCLLWISTGLWHPFANPRTVDGSCTVLSVGHGSSTVIELPDGRIWLYDAGSLGNANHALSAVSHFLWSRRVAKVDTVILSHADVDHYNAIPGLLDRFSIGRVLVPPNMFRGGDISLVELRRALEQSQTPIVTVQAGSELVRSKALRIEVLHPHPSMPAFLESSDNAKSIVLSVTNGDRSMLLTGDLEAEGLDHLMASRSIDCDVAIAPHHGSTRSRPEEFCRWCSPESVVISAGVQTALASGTQAYLMTGCDVYHTSLCGAVRISFAPDGFRLSTHRPHTIELIKLAQNFSQSE